MLINNKFIGFFSILVLFLITLLSAYLLRQNNLKMVALRNEVVKADEDSGGEIEKIEPALEELRNFVNSHMNTTMQSPVQLQNRYNKVVDEIIAEQEKSDTAYRQAVYRRAEDKCNAVLQSVRVPCIQEYISSQPGVEPLDLPPVEQFSYEFSSPIWSLDLAGLNVLINVIFGFILAFMAIVDYAIPTVIATFKNDPLE